MYQRRPFRRTQAWWVVAALLTLVSRPAWPQAPLRGDSNSDLKVDVSDAVFSLNYLFAGGAAPKCIPAADANADRRLNISDPVATLNFLFLGRGALPALTAAEMALCDGSPPPTVLRSGRLIDALDPGHGLDGSAEELSNRVIRLRDFYYDGLGEPQVVVLLTKVRFENMGVIVSADLRRDRPYVQETLEFALPEGVTSADFDFVEIWCDALPLTFGYAGLLARR